MKESAHSCVDGFQTGLLATLRAGVTRRLANAFNTAIA